MREAKTVAEGDSAPPDTIPTGIEQKSMGWSIVYPGVTEDDADTYWGAWSKKEDAETALEKVKADKYDAHTQLENSCRIYP
jgi:hypothetical protein